MKLIPSAAAAGVIAVAIASVPAFAQNTPPPVAITSPPAPPAPPAPPPGLPEGTLVSIPFAPPLGTELRYSHYRSDEKGGKSKAVFHDIAVSFERAGAGYRMTVKVAVPNVPPALKANPMIRLMERPVVFRLSREGDVEDMEQEDEYWRALDEIGAAINRHSPGGPEEAEALRKVMAHMRGMPKEQRMALAFRHVAPLLELVGAEVRVGETFELPPEDSVIPIPTAQEATVRSTTVLKVSRADAASATVEAERRFDQESFREAVEEIVKLAPPGKQAEAQAGLEDMEVSERASWSVSRRTGLAQRYMVTTEAKGGGERFRRVIIIKEEKSSR